jgi:GTP-binding protein Era
MIREKLFRQLGDELPYQSTVEIERFEELRGLRRIHAAILVQREAQKAIVVGQGGERVRRLSIDARHELEKLFGSRVHLELFVKVESGWADSEASLRAHGYE